MRFGMTGRYLMLLALVGMTTLGAAGPRRAHVKAPGFGLTADGGSRLFVPLSSKVEVEERRSEGTITYVLKRASVRVRNNTHALVTEHFNTPVLRARLVPRGADVHLVVELRAATAPTWKLVDQGDGSAALEIAFPAGTFVVGEPVIVAPIRRLEDPEDGPTLWPTIYEASAPATDRAPERRATADGRRGQSPTREDVEQQYLELRGKMRKRGREEQARNPTQRVTWEGSDDLAKKNEQKRRADEERLRQLREKKRQQREAVYRETQALDRPGGAGTAVQVPANER